MDMKQVSVVVPLDMSKAFDSIRHDLMLSKLRKAGAGDSAIAWFESYFSRRTQTVKIQDTLSTSLPLSACGCTTRFHFGTTFIYSIRKRDSVSS